MNLKGNKPLEIGVLLVGVGEVCAKLSIEVGLQMVPLALDHDGIPAIPVEEAVPLFGEGPLLFSRLFSFLGIEPTSACFIVNPRRPGTLGLFEVIMLTLIARHPTVFLLALLKGPKHATGVPRLIDELELEGQDEITELILGPKEGIAPDVFPESPDCSVLDFIGGAAPDLLPTGEILAIEDCFESCFLKGRGIRLGRQTGWHFGHSLFGLTMVIGKTWKDESKGKKQRTGREHHDQLGLHAD